MTLAAALTAAPALPQVQCPAQAPKAQGHARLTWFGLPIYDATLCVDAAFNPDEFDRSTFVLELAYRRALRSPEIAKRSVKEMRRAAEFGDDKARGWDAALRAVLPDVRDGDRIAGVNRPGSGAQFYVNGKFAGEIADAEFARLFFSIWLAPTTSEPAMREELLGKAAR